MNILGMDIPWPVIVLLGVTVIPILAGVIAMLIANIAENQQNASRW